jgi:catecholate siderophore receptor
MFKRSVSVFALTAALAAPAQADAGALDYAEADPIIVTGIRDTYIPQSTRAATRTDTDLKDVPQAITVITAQQIDDQALRSVADVLTYVPGAAPGTGEGNRDQITLRGNNTTADFFVDGIRDDVQYYRDLYNIDRIEVLKGPNAMIFGRGGGGGVVNRVTKRSTLAPYRAFSASGDSQGGIRIAGDVDQPLAGNIGLRVNGVYEDGESFRHGVELERYAVNPTIGFAPGEDTRIDLSYEYLHDRRTTDRGVPAGGDRPLEGARRTFFGDPALSFAQADVHLASFAVEHRLSETLTIRNRTHYADYGKFYQNVFPSDLDEATGQVRLSAYNDTSQRENLFSQTDLVRDADLAGIDQTILFGFELGRQESASRRRNGFFQPRDTATLDVPVGSPTIDADVVFRPVNTNSGRTPANFSASRASIAAVYLQDQIRLSDRFEIVAGVRFERFRLGVDNLNNGQTFGRTDQLFSPRFGLIAKPAGDVSLYAGYSRSYLPSAGDQFGSLDITSEALRPERFDNYEVGAKWAPLKGLLASAALYQLDRTNTRAAGPNPGEIVLTGAQRSRGLELGLQGDITQSWQISAGYAVQEAKIVRATAAAPEGREAPLVPRHQLSMWNRYDVNSQLGVGLGVIARSKTFASVSNAVTLPGYARLDAALFYTIAPGIEAQLNVENLLGTHYFATAHNDNNIAPGAPATGRATLRFRF